MYKFNIIFFLSLVYNYNNPYPYGTNYNYAYPNLGSTYGSGIYPYGSSLNGYGPVGFNNQFPNWDQGNSAQYYTGGTDNGLVNNGYYWYGALQRSSSQGRPRGTTRGKTVESNPPAPIDKQIPGGSSGK